ncbi:hypothetical protein HYH02_002997 [Chlamydomonas schloesseri]|uniref:Uncharacterized protein n=1 Tax=Chlamydomonas schloesseri TaxID=2026947 RepID=A0A836BAL3_9CHLO|nr:hypothetical protein HYH02_002997 [Chlamydomonas schloesseri]|eukprot:KAG2452767.1 hypothetical protein HYH02_002997 [Chlamydomonas schloesseri]
MDTSMMEPPPGGGSGEPVGRPRVVLGPGQLSKPEKVWSSSSTLIIGFYQAAPYSDAFRIFYKKSGSVFGTQVTLQPASILGPELAVRQPVIGEVQYFEYEIKKLKPSTQYVIKIKTSDAGESAEVRSDKMGTVSYEEERTRDNDMRNFVGAMVKLGEYDGLVLSYAPSSGIFGIRILQLDDLAASLQLARLGSDYTDNGVPVQAYTLSQIRFGRWGGAITGSKVVNEGELKWLVARAVQMGQKSEASAAFEAEKKMLQTQVELVATNLDSQWADRFRNLRLRAFAYALMLMLVAVCGGLGMWGMLHRSGRRHRELVEALAARGAQLAAMEAELDMLHLYRVSLELDVERRVAAGSGSGGGGGGGARNGTGALRPGDWDPAAAAAAAAGGSSSSSSSSSNDSSSSSRASRSLRSVGLLIKQLAERGNGTAADGEDGEGEDGAGGGGDAEAAEAAAAAAAARGGKGGAGSKGAAAGNKGGQRGRGGGGGSSGVAAGRGGGKGKGKAGAGGGGGRRQQQEAAGVPGGGDGGSTRDLWGLPQEAVRRAIGGSWGSGAAAAAAGGGGGALARSRPQRHAWLPAGGEDEEQPDAWMFIHYVSHVYAAHLQEWMQVQLQRTVRRKVNDMLLRGAGAGPGATAGAAAPTQPPVVIANDSSSSSGGAAGGAPPPPAAAPASAPAQAHAGKAGRRNGNGNGGSGGKGPARVEQGGAAGRGRGAPRGRDDDDDDEDEARWRHRGAPKRGRAGASSPWRQQQQYDQQYGGYDDSEYDDDEELGYAGGGGGGPFGSGGRGGGGGGRCQGGWCGVSAQQLGYEYDEEEEEVV